MKRILLLYILFCGIAGSGIAQTITVDPEVICAGENSYIGTDTNLNYVHIGDIICVGNASHDTIIVRPEAWSMYSGSYTALSVVFYVDQTGKHGWAVKAASAYESKKWNNLTSSRKNTCLTDYANPRDALKDMDGESNTRDIRDATICSTAVYTTAKYPAVASVTTPFYLPAIGQLNYLYAQKKRVNEVLNIVVGSESIAEGNWWSSTENSQTNVYRIIQGGVVESSNKTNSCKVFPTMNF